MAFWREKHSLTLLLVSILTLVQEVFFFGGKDIHRVISNICSVAGEIRKQGCEQNPHFPKTIATNLSSRLRSVTKFNQHQQQQPQQNQNTNKKPVYRSRHIEKSGQILGGGNNQNCTSQYIGRSHSVTVKHQRRHHE